MNTINTAACQCAEVRYQIKGQPFDCLYCHCSVCRRLTGSAMAAYGSVLGKNFKWLAGEELTSKYAQNDNCYRTFCSLCGSNLIATHKLAPDHVYLSLGCLNLHENIEIEYQQFVASKANWLRLDPLIPQHHGWPDWISTKIS